ncbi:MAG TPA: 1-acyl-sn-glycerol-3-phosphate acyltransferase [Saprospiraceae bacterium]|nr:1-acyl-sn-glycerol-3-phosphate acyltransferase [Saprospiraceae bacterium]
MKKSTFYTFLLKMYFGFKVTRPENAFASKRRIFVVAPHTSNWDFPLGILLRASIGLKVQFIGKHTLFRPPFGFIFRWLGGIPVDRRKSNNFVDAIVEALKSYDEISISLAPEGTRKYTDEFRTGFYWIAQKANLDIILVKFDWANKVVDFSPIFEKSGNTESDITAIKDYFKGTLGKIPKNSYTSH